VGPLSGAPISRPPSTYVPGRVYACIFDDVTALAVAERVIAEGGLDERETRALLRGNAIECYGLGRLGRLGLVA
jgi:hypothetical protein